MDPAGQMVLANRLTDGRVVFLAAHGGWVDDIAAGALAPDASTGTALLEAARRDEGRNVVVEPDLIKVRQVGGRYEPVAWRDVIRAAGPTVRTDLG